MKSNDELGRFDGMSNIEVLHYMIDGLPDASTKEIAALHDILDVEGFGGREDQPRKHMAAVAEERLEWLRSTIERNL
jgi:hypothetical protein